MEWIAQITDAIQLHPNLGTIIFCYAVEPEYVNFKTLRVKELSLVWPDLGPRERCTWYYHVILADRVDLAQQLLAWDSELELPVKCRTYIPLSRQSDLRLARDTVLSLQEAKESKAEVVWDPFQYALDYCSIAMIQFLSANYDITPNLEARDRHLTSIIRSAIQDDPQKFGFLLEIYQFGPQIPQWVRCFQVLCLAGTPANFEVLLAHLRTKVRIADLPTTDITIELYWFRVKTLPLRQPLRIESDGTITINRLKLLERAQSRNNQVMVDYLQAKYPET